MKVTLLVLSLLMVVISEAQITCDTLTPLITNTGNLCDGSDTLTSCFDLGYTTDVYVIIIKYSSPDSLDVVSSDTIFKGFHALGHLVFKTAIDSSGTYFLNVRVFTETIRCDYISQFYGLVLPCTSGITDISPVNDTEIKMREYYSILGLPCQFTKGTLLIEKITTLTGEVAYRKVVRE